MPCFVVLTCGGSSTTTIAFAYIFTMYMYIVALLLQIISLNIKGDLGRFFRMMQRTECDVINLFIVNDISSEHNHTHHNTAD